MYPSPPNGPWRLDDGDFVVGLRGCLGYSASASTSSSDSSRSSGGGDVLRGLQLMTWGGEGLARWGKERRMHALRGCVHVCFGTLTSMRLANPSAAAAPPRVRTTASLEQPRSRLEPLRHPGRCVHHLTPPAPIIYIATVRLFTCSPQAAPPRGWAAPATPHTRFSCCRLPPLEHTWQPLRRSRPQLPRLVCRTSSSWRLCGPWVRYRGL